MTTKRKEKRTDSNQTQAHRQKLKARNKASNCNQFAQYVAQQHDVVSH